MVLASACFPLGPRSFCITTWFRCPLPRTSMQSTALTWMTCWHRLTSYASAVTSHHRPDTRSTAQPWLGRWNGVVCKIQSKPWLGRWKGVVCKIQSKPWLGRWKGVVCKIQSKPWLGRWKGVVCKIQSKPWLGRCNGVVHKINSKTMAR